MDLMAGGRVPLRPAGLNRGGEFGGEEAPESGGGQGDGAGFELYFLYLNRPD